MWTHLLFLRRIPLLFPQKPLGVMKGRKKNIEDLLKKALAESYACFIMPDAR